MAKSTVQVLTEARAIYKRLPRCVGQAYTGDVRSPTAVCAWAALVFAQFGDNLPAVVPYPQPAAFKILERVMGDAVGDWHDTHTKRGTLAAFTKAIRLASKKRRVSK